MGESAREVLAGIGIGKAYAERGGALSAKRLEVRAVVGVTLRLGRAERMGLVGGSGAGKSTTVRILAGLETPDAGKVLYEGREVSGMSRADRRRFQRSVQVVFQDPGGALDPRQRIGSAVAEPLTIHGSAHGDEARRRVAEVMVAVGLPADRKFAARYPHELSGGERQRVVIARALACDPKVLLLDEPVAALDVSVRGQVLNLLLDLQSRLGLTMLLVAHDIFVVEASCDRMAIMYRGSVVEEGGTSELVSRPAHPYTQALVAASAGRQPAIGGAKSGKGAGLPGASTTGCPYRGTCPRADGRCTTDPILEPVDGEEARRVACWNSLLT